MKLKCLEKISERMLTYLPNNDLINFLNCFYNTLINLDKKV